MKNLPDLYFLENRNYVQGATVMRYALKKVQEELGCPSPADLFVRRFKQIAEVKTPINVYLDQQVPPGKPLCATLFLEYSNQKYQYQIIPLPGTLPRVPTIEYHQIDYQESGLDEAMVILPHAGDFWEVVTEAVQLTKVFHINKYNCDNNNFRFMVGGFDNFRPVVSINEFLTIVSKIAKHALIKGDIYNMVLINVIGRSVNISFNLPFIGKRVN